MSRDEALLVHVTLHSLSGFVAKVVFPIGDIQFTQAKRLEPAALNNA